MEKKELIVNKFLEDNVTWEKVEISNPSSGSPYVTHGGTLRLGDIELKCYILNTGQRIFDADDFEKFMKILSE